MRRPDMSAPVDLPAEVRAMLDAMTPPARTAIGHVAANVEVIEAARAAMAAGDFERADDLLRQPMGSRPLDPGDSFPPSRRRRTE